jgi:hypothetical protein
VALLGSTFKDTQGNVQPMSDLLPQLADRFAGMADGPAKTALAMKLFGKGGADMIKILNKGSQGLKDFAAESDKTGNTLKDTDALKEQMAAQREFSASITGLKIQLGKALIPILTAVSQFLITHVAPAIQAVTGYIMKQKDIGALLTLAFKKIGAALATLAGFLGKHRSIVLTVIGAYVAWKVATIAMNVVSAVQLVMLKAQTVGTMEQAVASKTVAAATKIWTATTWALGIATKFALGPVGLIIIGVTALVAVVVIIEKKTGFFSKVWKKAWSGIKTAFSATLGFIKAKWPLILAILVGPIGIAVLMIVKHWDQIKAGAGKVLDWIKKKWPLILAILVGPIGIAVLLIVKNWDRIKEGASRVLDWIGSNWRNVLGLLTIPIRAAVDVIVVLWDRIRAGATRMVWNVSHALSPLVSAFNAVRSAIEAVISALGHIHVPSINLPHIPGMARGGISPGGLTLVGEQGPELVTLPRGARVTPNGQSMAAMRGGGSGGDITIPITLQLEGETVVRAILRYQRRTGKTFLVSA